MLVGLYVLSRVVKAKKARQALADAEDEEYEDEDEYDDGYPAYFHCRRCKNRMDKMRIEEQLQGKKRTGDGEEEEIFD